MGVFKNLLSGGVGSLVSSLGDVADRFIPTEDKRNAFKLEMQSRINDMQETMETTHQLELESRADIIKYEMSQGDKFTKRARPTIVYAGLLFIFMVYVIVPMIVFIAGKEPPQINLPDQFWWAWGTVVGVYGLGRSAEKMGIVNKFTNMVTGGK
jgi:hypothetical protein